jgi:hypothetical protein
MKYFLLTQENLAEIGCEVIRKIPRILVIQNVWEILYPILNSLYF